MLPTKKLKYNVTEHGVENVLRLMLADYHGMTCRDLLFNRCGGHAVKEEHESFVTDPVK